MSSKNFHLTIVFNVLSTLLSKNICILIFVLFYRVGIPVVDGRVQGRTHQKTVVEAAHIVNNTI